MARWRTAVLRLVGVAVLAGAVVWAVHDLDAGLLFAAVARADPRWLVLAAAVNLLAILLMAARWLALLRPLSDKITLGAAFKALVVGAAVSMVVPARAGEVAKIQWMSRRTGVARASLLGSVVLDYLVNAGTLLLGLGMLPFFMPIPSWIRGGILLTLVLFSVGVAVIVAARPAREAAPLSAGAPPPGRMAGLVLRAREGLAAAGDPAHLGISAAASLASWIVELDVLVLTMFALDVQAPVAAAAVALLAVNVALAFPFAPPANVGTIELGAALSLMTFGVPKEQAVAFGLVYHVLQLVPVGLLGVLFAWPER